MEYIGILPKSEMVPSPLPHSKSRIQKYLQMRRIARRAEKSLHSPAVQKVLVSFSKSYRRKEIVAGGKPVWESRRKKPSRAEVLIANEMMQNLNRIAFTRALSMSKIFGEKRKQVRVLMEKYPWATSKEKQEIFIEVVSIIRMKARTFFPVFEKTFSTLTQELGKMTQEQMQK